MLTCNRKSMQLYINVSKIFAPLTTNYYILWGILFLFLVSFFLKCPYEIFVSPKISVQCVICHYKWHYQHDLSENCIEMNLTMFQHVVCVRKQADIKQTNGFLDSFWHNSRSFFIQNACIRYCMVSGELDFHVCSFWDVKVGTWSVNRNAISSLH